MRATAFVALVLSLSACDLLSNLGKNNDAGVTNQAPTPNDKISTSGKPCSATDGGTAATNSDAGLTPAQAACVDTYTSCMMTNCETSYQKCLGPNYKTGTFGGECANYMNCLKTNPQCDACSASGCNNCPIDPTCQSCFTNDLAQCAISNCINPFTTCFIGTIGGIASGGCAGLESCCKSMTGSNKTDCESALANAKAIPFGADAACSTTLTAYKNSKKCQ